MVLRPGLDSASITGSLDLVAVYVEMEVSGRTQSIVSL